MAVPRRRRGPRDRSPASRRRPASPAATGGTARRDARTIDRTRLALRHRVPVRADVARVPGHLDPAARVGDRQHDVRVHRDPRDLPGRASRSGPFIFNLIRSRLRDPVGWLAVTQVLVGALALLGLVVVLGRPETLTPGSPVRDARRPLRFGACSSSCPSPSCSGIAFPTASALLRDDAGEAGSESGSLLAVNTLGAILGSLLVPFVLMPTIGSPAIIVVLAAMNACVGLGLAVVARPGDPADRHRARSRCSWSIAVLVVRPGAVVQPNEAYIASRGGTIFDSTEDEIASVQAGQVTVTPELWVAGTSMTLLTVDAKLMPILPLIARPDAKRILVVAFGMGTAFRSAADRRAGRGRRGARARRSRRCSSTTTRTPTSSSRTRTAGSSSPTAGITSSSRPSSSTSS